MVPTELDRRLRILAFAPNAWDGPWMNRQQLLSRLARHHTILYSTGPRRRGHSVSTQPTLFPRVVLRDNVSIDVLPKWIAHLQRLQSLNGLVMRQLARRWKRLLGDSDGSLVGWSFHPKFWPWILRVNPDAIVYHAYDLFHKQGEWTSQMAEYESCFLRHARLVVASSEPIAEYLRQRGAQSVLVVENGVDYEAFAAGSLAPEPLDIHVVPHPRIGYAGALNRKVDFPLLLELASRHAEWHFVLIGAFGNLDEETSAAVERLRDMSNVHILGFKHHRDLPAYVSAMDVNLLAYRLGPQLWTEGIYPLKLHEYLASGRPVVGADMSTLRKFSDIIAIADTLATWEEAVAAALIDVSPDASERRRAVARANSWEMRAALLERELRILSS